MLSLRCEVNEQLYFRNGSQLKHVRPLSIELVDKISEATVEVESKIQEDPQYTKLAARITGASSPAFAHVIQGRYSILT